MGKTLTQCCGKNVDFHCVKTRVRVENARFDLGSITYLIQNSFFPKLIIPDLNMPIMNGTQTLLHIKRDPILKQIPIIIYSTSENEKEKRKCLSFGSIDFVVKPMGYPEGLELIKGFISYIS